MTLENRAQARLNEFATHLPLLLACVSNTHGSVLELGCGSYSTPLVHAVCLGRELWSYEGSAEWYARFKRFHRGSHRVQLASNWTDIPIERPWDVALVDHSPAARRAVEVTRLRGHARLIVVHDTEHRLYDLEPVLAPFKHRVEWRAYSPWTSVDSDVDDLAWLADVASGGGS